MARILFSLLFLFAAVLASAQESFTGPRTALAERSLAALPSEAGQFWMVYDLTPYTSLYPNLPNPEQAIVSWILQDTGKDFWFKEPFGVISADKNKLYVYHTAAVQQYISNVLDRFMDTEKKNIVFQIQIFLLDTPDWRTKTASMLHPYPVSRQEISGWILAKADVPAFLQAISKRSDYTELNASRSDVPNTELFGWVLPAQERTYVRDIQVAASSPQGYVSDVHKIDEGYRFEATPLVSTNGEQAEILFSCSSTVVGQTLPVPLKIPTASAPRQILNAETPQIAHTELTDKVSFPLDQAFLLDLGMIPMPEEASVDKPISLSGIVSGRSIYKNVLVLIRKNDL
ncbi:MAG: hypothetical protein IJJ20_02300 [Thermoguttaceae bacterium]|nr:hypothetical protein [Thermoguttaceae bacterium]